MTLLEDGRPARRRGVDAAGFPGQDVRRVLEAMATLPTGALVVLTTCSTCGTPSSWHRSSC